MYIQDLSYAQCQVMLATQNMVVVPVRKEDVVEFDNINNKIPHPEDVRFVLPDPSPYHRKLVTTFENDQVLVGVFYILENQTRPYPFNAQYSIYIVDKKDPTRDCGGGIYPSNFCYPPVALRDKGICRTDIDRLINFINDGLKQAGIDSEFLVNPNSYHQYHIRPEFDAPHPGQIGDEHRVEDGVLRRLEAVYENNEFRIEIVSMPERFTEYVSEQRYSVDIFKNGKCINGQSFVSKVIWPPVRDRKFGIDYLDYETIRKWIRQICDYYEIRPAFTVPNNKEGGITYLAPSKNLDQVLVVRRKDFDTYFKKSNETT